MGAICANNCHEKSETIPIAQDHLLAERAGTATVPKDRLSGGYPQPENIQITDSITIEYITDIEGNWDYMLRFVQQSKILFWDGDERGAWGPGTLCLRRDGILVFGGDAVDKGPGDIRLVKTFLDLKKRYPSQFFIVLGNRDIMKLRFAAELADTSWPEIWLPTWAPSTKPYEKFLEEEKLDANQISKCKWLLHCTMGCQDTTFRTRRSELALLNGRVCDDDVVQSYTRSVAADDPDPWMLQFLQLGQMAVVLGDTLFVHGGVQDESLGAVPGQTQTCESVIEWAQKLNHWKDSELNAYIDQPYWRSVSSGCERGGATLIEYCTPGGGKRSIVYHNPFNNGNPVQNTLNVQDFLNRSGVHRLLSGHQPHGQLPSVVRHLKTGLLAITCDTSRSDSCGDKLNNPAESRGTCVTVVRMQGAMVYLEGIRNDGLRHSCKLHIDPLKDVMPDALVGRQLTDGSWVKSIDRETSEAIIARGRGWNIEVQSLSYNAACLKLCSEYGWGGAFKVHLKDVSADCVREVQKSIEDCTDVDTKVNAKNFDFNAESFQDASTYIFASISGVLGDKNTPKGEKILEIINNMIFMGKRVLFISNDSSMSRRSMFEKLVNTHGVNLYGTASTRNISANGSGDTTASRNKSQYVNEVRKLHCISSSNTCAWFCQQAGIKKPFIVCPSAGTDTGLLDELHAHGINDYVSTAHVDGSQKKEFIDGVQNHKIMELMKEHPDVDAVIVGWDHHFTGLKIAVAAQYVRWGVDRDIKIPIITCGIDSSGHLGETPHDYNCKHGLHKRKVRAVGVGIMSHAINRCAEMKTEPINVGKPSMLLLEQLRRPASEGGLEIDFEKTVLIGSTMDTDIALANKGGMRSLLVLTGVCSRDNVRPENMLASQTPTWVLDSFADAS